MNIHEMHEEIDPLLTAQKYDCAKFVGEQMAKLIRPIPQPDFESTIGDDIPVSVYGDYAPEDKSVGFGAAYQVTKVCIITDIAAHDILGQLPEYTIDRLNHEGLMKKLEQKSYFKRFGEV